MTMTDVQAACACAGLILGIYALIYLIVNGIPEDK